jgi:FRG domain
VETSEIGGFDDFIKITRSQNPTGGYFYRGEKRSDWRLLPKIGRITKSVVHGEIVIKEKYQGLRLNLKEAFQAFKDMSQPHLSKVPSNDFDWMTLAQHHSLPTNLLDWTTNPLVALFFALNEKIDDNWLEREKIGFPDYNGDAAFYIWQPRPGTRLDKTGDVFSTDGYFFPAHHTNRIPNQGGVMSIHSNPHDIFSPRYLRKYTIPFDIRMAMRDELRILGINDAFIFSDLDAVAREIEERITRL